MRKPDHRSGQVSSMITKTYYDHNDKLIAVSFLCPKCNQGAICATGYSFLKILSKEPSIMSARRAIRDVSIGESCIICPECRAHLFYFIDNGINHVFDYYSTRWFYQEVDDPDKLTEYLLGQIDKA